MTKAKVGDWSTTANNNLDINGINIAENCPAANVNNAMREMMAQLADEYALNAPTFRARNAENAALAVALPAGTVFVMDGLFYKVSSGGAVFDDLSVSGAIPYGVVTAEHYGAVPFGTGEDARDAINAAMQYCATNGAPGQFLADKYDVRGTIAPGGPLAWNWGVTQLTWENVDFSTEDLTVTATWAEIEENPTGTTEPEGSGKYVLFDTKGMRGSHMQGYATIKGSAPGNMTVANAASVPSVIVAVTASEGSSAEIRWDALQILGCGEALWQGDQRGSGPIMNPYTSWKIGLLVIQFCLRCFRAGPSGNAFDEMFIGTLRMKRNKAFGVLRGPLKVGVAFFNALQEVNGDTETPMVTFPRATSSDNSFTSSANLGLSVGDILYTYGANFGPNGTTDIPFVSRVTAYTHPNGTTESVPDQAVTGASVHINPTTPLLLNNGSFSAGEIFFEEAADGFVQVDQKSKLICGQFKVSDGRIGCRYNVPIFYTARNGGLVQGALEGTSEVTSKVKAMVGIPVMQNTTGDEEFNSANVELASALRSSEWSDGQPVKAIALESDHLPTDWADRFGDLHPGTINATCRFGDGTVSYAIGGGDQEAYKVGPNGGFEIGDNLRSNEDMTGFNVTGDDTSVGGGQVTKVAGVAGTCFDAVTVSTGDRLRVKIVISALTAGQIIVRAYNGSGTDISPRTMRIRSAGTYYTFFDAPNTMARIGVEFPATSAAVLNSLVLQKVASA